MTYSLKHAYYYAIKVECSKTQYEIYKDSLDDEIIMYNSYYSSGNRAARFGILCNGKHDITVVKELFNIK